MCVYTRKSKLFEAGSVSSCGDSQHAAGASHLLTNSGWVFVQVMMVRLFGVGSHYRGSGFYREIDYWRAPTWISNLRGILQSAYASCLKFWGLIAFPVSCYIPLRSSFDFIWNTNSIIKITVAVRIGRDTCTAPQREGNLCVASCDLWCGANLISRWSGLRPWCGWHWICYIYICVLFAPHHPTNVIMPAGVNCAHRWRVALRTVTWSRPRSDEAVNRK